MDHSHTIASVQKDKAPAAAEVSSTCMDEIQMMPFPVAGGLPVQCKLSVGAPDDPLEHEADAMADRVMRMPSSNFIQRKCAHCEEEEKVQRKPLSSFIQRNSAGGSTEASDSLSSRVISDKGNGSEMDGGTRNFMESRFGADFSNVRIHTGSESVQMNRELNAKAFTVGSDIYFNEGQYQSSSFEGGTLLAHELTHVVQQSKGGQIVQRSTDSCPKRPAGEIEDSKRPEGIIPVNIVFSPGSQQLVIQDFAVNSAVIPQNVTNSMDWQTLMSILAGDPSIRLGVGGYTDCVGDSGENISLRKKRTAAVEAAMPATVKAKIIFDFVVTADNYLAPNDSAENRARNRSVIIKYLNYTDDGCGLLKKAGNIDQYIYLVSCAETKLGLSNAGNVKTFVSMLRQIYYGGASWSASSNSVWNFVIPDKPWKQSDDPSAKLGSVFSALKNSQVVDGTDIGHILTGIDAMFNPQTVVLKKGSFGLDTDLMNEEWATWAGDVGSAAAEWAIDANILKADVDKLDDYYKRFASDSDMKGDIDSFAIRQGLNPTKKAPQNLGSIIQLNQRLSEMLRQYFRVSGTSAGKAGASKFKIFIEAYGGVIKGKYIDNKDALHDKLAPSVDNFARMFALKKLYDIKDYNSMKRSDVDLGYLLDSAIQYYTDVFINWLEANL